MEESVQTFPPLVTEIHPAAEAKLIAQAALPAGLLRLRETGREARRALLAAGLLGAVSLVLAAVLFFGRGSDALVVWQAGEDRVLVEVP